MKQKPSKEARAAAGLLRLWCKPGRWPVKEDLLQLAADMDRIAGKVEAMEGRTK